MKLDAYSDGGCIGNPGPGAWAFVIITPEGTIEDSGFDADTTNNRMELTAVIRLLEKVGTDSSGSQLRIHTDSQYVQKGISQWIHSWKRNGWKTAGKKPVKNKDLWMQLDTLAAAQSPEWIWVKGHAGIDFNERCDELVQQSIAQHRDQ